MRQASDDETIRSLVPYYQNPQFGFFLMRLVSGIVDKQGIAEAAHA